MRGILSQPAVEGRDPRGPGLGKASLRVIVACVLVAVPIALSSGTRSPIDVAVWLIESLTGAVFGLAAARWLVPASWLSGVPWRAALLIAAVVTLPVTGIVLAVNGLVRHHGLSLAILGEVTPEVFFTSLSMTALAFLVRRRDWETHAAPPGAPPPKFLARLPNKLKGAEVWAVEAQDHYLRLHTSLGQDLILMRLSDAVAELEGIEGAQTHRSWWVARAAVVETERAEGRATLTLKDGAKIPVSRGFAKGLRDEGWL